VSGSNPRRKNAAQTGYSRNSFERAEHAQCSNKREIGGRSGVRKNSVDKHKFADFQWQHKQRRTKVSNRISGEGKEDCYVAPETNDEKVEHIPRISNVGRATSKNKAKRDDLDNAFEQENAHQYIVTVF
jgi:hypothetical protein